MTSKIVLCDIEGTTTSISFVKENLFPYAAKNVDSFLDAKWDAADTQEAVKMLRDQSQADKKDNLQGCVEIAAATEDKAKQIESLVANVKWQMEHDRKAGPLKNLQGLMWVEAYKEGAFKGQVYADVAPAFEAWTKAGRKIYIYSSGSAAIQKVHFEHSDAGDLAKYLSGYFDTKVGAKQDKASYEAIWKEVSKEDATLNTKDVLFLTDIPAEAKAAQEAGMEVVLLKRPGNQQLTEAEMAAYKVVESFADIVGNSNSTVAVVKEEEEEAATKRKIEDDAAQDDEATKPPSAKVAKIEAVNADDGDKAKQEEEQKTEAKTAASDEAAVTAAAKNGEAKTEEDTQKTTQDVPMEATESTATAEQKTDADNDDEKMNGKAEEKKVPGPNKKAEEEKEAEEEETMEVDSTTASTPPAEVGSTTAALSSAAPDQEKEKKIESAAPDLKAEKTTKPETESVKGSAEALVAAETPQCDSGDAAEKKKKKTADETDKKTAEEDITAESLATKENGNTDVTASSTKEEEERKPAENGAAIVAAVDGAVEAAKPTNGTAEPQQKNGNESAEAVATSNGHQDHDSDKENDKSMEAKAEEVSTTSGAATTTDSSDDAAVVAAKKCAAMDPATEPSVVAATPVPAEVGAES